MVFLLYVFKEIAPPVLAGQQQRRKNWKYFPPLCIITSRFG